MSKAYQQLRKCLTGQNLLWTAQRQVILQAILESSGHFDAEGLYRNLREKGERVSRATVYRLLPLLQGCGLIREVFRSGGRAKYERTARHHDHMVCVVCDKVIEFTDSSLKRVRENVSKRYGFKLVEYGTGIKGICRECQRSRRGERLLNGNRT